MGRLSRAKLPLTLVEHCEDAPDLKGYKRFHLGLPVFSKKNLEKVKKFQAGTFQLLAETLLLTS